MDSSYIGEPIQVEFDTLPLFSKRPHCPDRLIWRDEVFALVEVLEQWVDFGRRGRMSDNMQPEHAARAAQRGSWGVGRYTFRARFRPADGPEPTFNGTFELHPDRTFEFYYDRAPHDADDRLGRWFLRRELLGDRD